MPILDVPGATLHYQRTGQGNAVLLVQGAGVVGNGWRPQSEVLGGEFSLISFDNRGIGQSEQREGALTIETMATDALAILAAEGIDRFHLVGHSMGGIIAQQIALQVPGRVKSLSFLCTFSRGSEGARLTPALLGLALRMRIGTPAMRRAAFLDLVMPAAFLRTSDRPQLARDLEPLFGYDLANQPLFVMQQVRAMARYDAFSQLAQLGGIPTLVVSAGEDRIALPRHGRALAAAIPGARFVEIPEAGHAVTIQSASAINRLLAEHFRAAETASS